MRYLLIPVKDLTQAKQRLAGVMTQEERTSMAWTMLEMTFAAARASSRADRIAVVTLYQPAAELARSYGMEVIAETEQISESVSVDFGSREVEQLGATAVLRLPIDLPLMTTGEIDEIFAHDGPGPSTVIVPSRDGTGTNAILRRPGTLFASQFGPHSLAKHLAAAARTRANYEVIHLSGIELDIDDVRDLGEFLARGQGTKLYDLLIRMGIPDRLG
jgi:2-phospho-L-lactate guanylyltransferase